MKKLLEQVEKRIEGLECQRREKRREMDVIIDIRDEVCHIRDMIKARIEEGQQGPGMAVSAAPSRDRLGCMWRRTSVDVKKGMVCSRQEWPLEKCDCNRMKGCPQRTQGDEKRTQCKHRKNENQYWMCGSGQADYLGICTKERHSECVCWERKQERPDCKFRMTRGGVGHTCQHPERRTGMACGPDLHDLCENRPAE